MRYSAYRSIAASSAALVVGSALAVPPFAGRPHYGGTLRVETRAKVMSLHPGEWPDIAEAETMLRLRELIYDHLVRLDGNGHPQPAIALSWEHDARWAKWRFQLRAGVKWHDGSALIPEAGLAAFEGMAPGGSVHLAGQTLEIDMGGPRPDLLSTLATAPDLIVYRPSAGSTDTLPVGTGPFRVTEWQPGHRAVFEANEDYWDGRPFVDKIEVAMGRSSRDQLLDLESDKADVVELDPGEARRAQQEGKKVWTSAPVELLALRFDMNTPVAQDRRLREAVADSIDRAAIQKVLFQNYGEVTGSIFPQRLSGYSFLFPATRNLDRARQLTAEVGTPPTLTLGYDSHDVLARETAERIAVNARDAGITLLVSTLPQGWRRMPSTGHDSRVERARIEGSTLREAELEAASELLFSTGGAEASPEVVYTAERKYLDDLSTVPLVYVPELVGLGPRVKGWSAMPRGDWRLESVSLEPVKP